MAKLTITTDDGAIVLELGNVQHWFDSSRYLLGPHAVAGALIDQIQQACAKAVDADDADEEELEAASAVLRTAIGLAPKDG